MKLSHWYRHKTKPIHLGIYQTKFREEFGEMVTGYSKWYGNFWGPQFDTLDVAISYSINCPGKQAKSWRGIIK